VRYQRKGHRTLGFHKYGPDLLTVTRTVADLVNAMRLLSAPHCRDPLSTAFSNRPFEIPSAGFPGINIPAAPSASGLPIGFQLVAPPGRDDLLCALAAQFEVAYP
jgi:hypothetical protein